MTPDQKGSLPIQMEKLFYDLQNRIYADVVRRIKKTGEITSTADYQINKLLILGNSTEFIEQEIKQLSQKSDQELWELYDKVSNWEYVRYKDAYQQINGHFVPLEENQQIRQWANAVIKQTKGDIKNITQSLGFTVDMGGGKKAFTPLSHYYQKYLDRACMDIVTGAFDYNTVLRRVVKEMTASGLKYVDYASGYTCRAPVAVRRAIMTGVSQLAAQINEQVAKDLGADTYEVTWHAGHRPSHWWGGNIYTKAELISVCRLGDVEGLCGANCRHSYLAFIPGVSVRTYTPEQLRNLEEKILANPCHKGLIVSDAVFSMDGDIVNLPQLVQIADRYHLLSMVDEAHATGVIGKTGGGIVEHYHNTYRPDIVMGTLSKAIGSEGGFVCGRKNLIDYLRNKARGFIFSTSLSPVTMAASYKALEFIEKNPQRVTDLQNNVQFFCDCLRQRGLPVSSDTGIIPIIIGDEEKALQVSQELFNRGYYISAIRYPTVKRGSARLRIALMATHTQDQLQRAASAIVQILKEKEVLPW